jgi:uncharacterized protein involved in cysteine biosynthesis
MIDEDIFKRKHELEVKHRSIKYDIEEARYKKIEQYSIRSILIKISNNTKIVSFAISFVLAFIPQLMTKANDTITLSDRIIVYVVFLGILDIAFFALLKTTLPIFIEGCTYDDR